MHYRYLFGPVLSRRLGISLGVDLVPYKVCTLDCVYCEVGKTTNLTDKRAEYISIQELTEELNDYLNQSPALDYITFSGGGEPTLNSQIDQVIQFIKTHYPQYKIALITNSTLLWDPLLRDQIRDIDLLLPSLDAVSEEIYQKINRNLPAISAQMIIDGLIEFRKTFNKPFWLEIFIIPGINDTPDELEKIKSTCLKIKPDKIQINSLDRPGTEEWVKSASREKLDQIADYFKPLNAEVIAKVSYDHHSPLFHSLIIHNILNLLQFKSCSLEELASTLSVHVNTILKHIRILIKENKIEEIKNESEVFYKLIQ